MKRMENSTKHEMDSVARSYNFAWIWQRAFCKLAFSHAAKSSEIISPQRRPVQQRRIRYKYLYRRIRLSTFFIDVYSVTQNIVKRRRTWPSKIRQYFDSCRVFTASRRTIIERQWHFWHEMRTTATLRNLVSTMVSLKHYVFLYGTSNFQHSFIRCRHTRWKHVFV